MREGGLLAVDQWIKVWMFWRTRMVVARRHISLFMFMKEQHHTDTTTTTTTNGEVKEKAHGLGTWEERRGKEPEGRKRGDHRSWWRYALRVSLVIPNFPASCFF